MSSVREPPSPQTETSVTKSMGDALYVIDRGRTESLPMEVEEPGLTPGQINPGLAPGMSVSPRKR
jgi:hypothetical protein